MANRSNFNAWEQFGGHVGQYCKDCEERHVGCHGTCERYLEAKSRHDEFVRAVNQNKKKESVLYEHKVKTLQKNDKKNAR